MKKGLVLSIFSLICISVANSPYFSTLSLAQSEGAACTVETVIDGGIGPATLDLLKRAQSRVERQNCESLLLLINTPGGNLQTTRLIVENILNSPVPVLCLVYPSGAHAGSAGAIILQACHVAGAMEATNIGAATPVSGAGEKIPEDLRKKLINDTVSWVEGLAKLRERDEKFAKEIVSEAKAVSASEALKTGAIDAVTKSKEEFIQFAQNKKVKMSKNQEAIVQIGEVKTFHQDLRYKIMDMLMSPQIAYMIFMGSLALLYFELTHPGIIAPGVVGGIGLVISLVSLHMLDVTWGAVLLILVGIGLMLAEAFVAGFGMLGVGGVVSFFIGSVFLFDPVETGHHLPISLILPTTLLVGGIMLGVAYLAFSSRKRPTHSGFDDIVGHTGVVSEVDESHPEHGFIEIQGEIWKVKSSEPLQAGAEVLVKAAHGLVLDVELKNKKTI